MESTSLARELTGSDSPAYLRERAREYLAFADRVEAEELETAGHPVWDLEPSPIRPRLKKGTVVETVYLLAEKQPSYDVTWHRNMGDEWGDQEFAFRAIADVRFIGTTADGRERWAEA